MKTCKTFYCHVYSICFPLEQYQDQCQGQVRVDYRTTLNTNGYYVIIYLS